MRFLSSILCTAVMTLTLSSPAFAAREKVEGIVAIVNSEIVTESEVRAFAKKVENEAIIDDLLLLGATPQSLKANRKAQLDYLINEKLLESEIKRLNLSVTVERVEQELRDVAKKNNISRAELNNAIKAQGMNFSDYQDFVKGRIERQSLIEQEITSKIRVSDEEVLAEYTKMHPNADSGIFEYTVAHILFNPRKGGVAGAEQRARGVLKKLKDGQVFETLAEQHSEDTGFTNGGLLGSFKAGEFSREMETAVARLSPGDTTEIIESKAGLHILKLISKKVVSDPRFEREKEKIRNQLFEKAFAKQLRNWLEQKKEDSFIRINEA